MEPTASFKLLDPASEEHIVVEIPVCLDMLDNPADRDTAIKTLGERVYEAAAHCLERRERKEAAVRRRAADAAGGLQT